MVAGSTTVAAGTGVATGTSGVVDGTLYLEKQAASVSGIATTIARRKPYVFVFITSVEFRRPTLEFTCARFSRDVTVKDTFAAQPRLVKSQD